MLFAVVMFCGDDDDYCPENKSQDDFVLISFDEMFLNCHN